MKTTYFYLTLFISLFLFVGCEKDSDEPDEVVGCMEAEACNYDSSANIPGDCDFESCVGCMEEEACNYDSNATIEEDSCWYELPNPIEIIYIEENITGLVGEDLIAHIHIRNASCNTPMNGLVVRRMNTNSAEPYFCFNDICFSSDTDTSPNPMDLDPGEVDDYFKAYLNSDEPGTFTVDYRFYLQGDQSVYVQQTITYTVN